MSGPRPISRSCRRGIAPTATELRNVCGRPALRAARRGRPTAVQAPRGTRVALLGRPSRSRDRRDHRCPAGDCQINQRPGACTAEEGTPRMTTELESQLRAALHEDARRARLANPDGPRVPDVAPVSESPRRARSGRGLVALAAAAIVAALAVAGIAFSTDDPSGVATTAPTPTTTPPDTAPPRFFPLAPEGAAPSAPVKGVILLSLQACEGPSSLPWSGNLALFADGRLLWHTFDDPFAGDPSSILNLRVKTGWLEQRLSPEGTELLRSELASSGLLSPRRESTYTCPSYRADARIGDHYEYYVGKLPRDLIERIAEPASWLPASAWEDREVRPFVPASYSVCFTGLEPRISVAEIAA